MGRILAGFNSMFMCGSNNLVLEETDRSLDDTLSSLV